MCEPSSGRGLEELCWLTRKAHGSSESRKTLHLGHQTSWMVGSTGGGEAENRVGIPFPMQSSLHPAPLSSTRHLCRWPWCPISPAPSSVLGNPWACRLASAFIAWEGLGQTRVRFRYTERKRVKREKTVWGMASGTGSRPQACRWSLCVGSLASSLWMEAGGFRGDWENIMMSSNLC